MQFFTGLVLTVCFCFSSGDEVTQTTTPKEETEGNRVTLECSYNTQSSYATLYWYRQYPGSAPQYILHRGYYTGTAEFAEGRFGASTPNGKTVLTISRLSPEDTAIYYCALWTNTGGVAGKLIFGTGTKLIIISDVASDPVYYKLEAEDKSVSACLASDFSNYSAANEEPFKNIKPTRIQGESLFSKVVAWTTGDDKCQSFVKEGGDTGRCDSDAYFETDEKVNFLSLTVLGLRILFLKSIVFNVLMTLRAWMS